MAIAFDAVSSGQASAATSLTISHTCSGSDRVLVVVCAAYDDWITGVTYNGVSMTQSKKSSLNAFRVTYAYTLANPATGANNIVISSSSTSTTLFGGGISLTGCEQTSFVDGTAESSTGSATNSPFNLNVTTTLANTLLVDYMLGAHSSGGQTVTAAGTNQTGRFNNTKDANNIGGHCSTMTTTTSGTKTFSWTSAEQMQDRAWVIVGIKEKVSSSHLLSTLGVGV